MVNLHRRYPLVANSILQVSSEEVCEDLAYETCYGCLTLEHVAIRSLRSVLTPARDSSDLVCDLLRLLMRPTWTWLLMHESEDEVDGDELFKEERDKPREERDKEREIQGENDEPYKEEQVDPFQEEDGDKEGEVSS